MRPSCRGCSSLSHGVPGYVTLPTPGGNGRAPAWTESSSRRRRARVLAYVYTRIRAHAYLDTLACFVQAHLHIYTTRPTSTLHSALLQADWRALAAQAARKELQAQVQVAQAKVVQEAGAHVAQARHAGPVDHLGQKADAAQTLQMASSRAGHTAEEGGQHASTTSSSLAVDRLLDDLARTRAELGQLRIKRQSLLACVQVWLCSARLSLLDQAFGLRALGLRVGRGKASKNIAKLANLRTQVSHKPEPTAPACQRSDTVPATSTPRPLTQAR